MARDRLMSLRQVQRILGSRATTSYQFRPQTQALTHSLPSLCDESHVVELDEEESSVNGLTRYLKQVEQIRNALRELEEDVESVKLKHSEILASPNPTHEPAHKELDSLMSGIKISTKAIKSKLKHIEDEILREAEEASEAHGGHYEAQEALMGSSQHRIKKTQHSVLLARFTDSINTYLTSQADYQDRLKEKMKRQLGVVGRHSITNDEDIEKLMDDPESWNIFARGIISEPAVTKQMMADIEQRHADILKLEQSIIELHDLFIEMSILVEVQGEHVDRIESKVASARDWVEVAGKELKKAREVQKSVQKKKFILIGGLAVIVVIIMIVVLRIALK